MTSLTHEQTGFGTSNLDCEKARWATARSLLTFAGASTVIKIDGDKCAAMTHFQEAASIFFERRRTFDARRKQAYSFSFQCGG
jgi:hypothetical protein